ncbi:MAG: TraB domain-containing protein [Candidatus Methanomethylophilaceae archaeon]|nr:TraB domain-containing protein [Candidatus Methanomethylophilaceae archaeon]
MITLLGTGHVFRIEEQTTFIIRSIWPDAVLVELDAMRYNALKNPRPVEERESSKGPWIYRHVAKYQKRMAGEYGGTVGAEMLAAVEAGMTVGAAIEFIDSDSMETVNRLWQEMPLREKVRLLFSFMRGNKASKEDLETEFQNYSDNEELYIQQMRGSYPTLVEVLIDSRNQKMADRIRAAAQRHQRIVAVVGDGHVEGIASLLADLEPKTIRLKVLMDEESMNGLRRELSSPQGTAGGE